MLYAYEDGMALRLIGQTPIKTMDVLNDIGYEQLFAFADADLTVVQDVLLACFRSLVNPDTLEIRESSEDTLQTAYDALASVHPFFLSSDHSTALPDLLAATYNALLIKKEITLTEQEYHRRLDALVLSAAVLCMNKTGYMETWHDELLMGKRYYEAYKAGRENGLTIAALIPFQKYVRSYLYWVLDASSERFKDLTLTERLRLFRQVFGETNAWQPLQLKEISCIGTPCGSGMRRIIERGQWRLIASATHGGSKEDLYAIADEAQKEKGKEAERQSYATVLSELCSDEPDLDADMRGWLKRQIATIKKETSKPLFKAYEISSFTDYILLQLRYLTEQSAIIKRCKNCGQYFITERPNIDYCQRILPGEAQTCFVIGPRRVYNKTLADDLPRNLYAKAYKRYQARLRRKTITEEEFEAWKADAKRYLDDVQKGRISTGDYQGWMEQ